MEISVDSFMTQRLREQAERYGGESNQQAQLGDIDWASDFERMDVMFRNFEVISRRIDRQAGQIDILRGALGDALHILQYIPTHDVDAERVQEVRLQLARIYKAVQT